MTGYRRLACAVLVKAVKDCAIYHSPGAKKIRRKYAQLLYDPDVNAREIVRREGIDGMGESHVMQILSVPEDPLPFLTSKSVWHELADRDPESFKDLNVKKAYKVIRWGTTTLRA